MTDELKASVARLRALAPKLNKVTDEANETVKTVEAFLVNECSLGLPAYVEEEGHRTRSPSYSLGFDRIEGKFRILVRTTQWTNLDDEPVSEAAEDAEAVEDTYEPWSDVPRAVKLRTLPILPELLKTLALQAQDAIDTAAKTTTTIKEMMAAIGATPRKKSPDTAPVKVIEYEE